MRQILYLTPFFLLFSSCSQSPEFVVHDQVLEWPALDSVTDIRSQLVFDGEKYLLAGELSILSLEDTLSFTQAEVLYTFHDSLWDHYTPLKWPGEKRFRPSEIDHDHFRAMPACFINRIFPVDKDNLLIFLAFNSVHSDSRGTGNNLHQISFLFNFKTHEMNQLPGPHIGNYKIGEITYRGEFDDISPLKIVKVEKDFLIYSGYIYYYEDSSHIKPTPGIVSYDKKTNEMEFFIDPPDTATWIPGKLLATNRSIYALTEQGASVLVQFDTAGSYRDFFRDAAFFSSNDPDICAVRLIWNEPQADFTLQLAHIEQNGREKIFHEISNVTIPGRTLYETDKDKLVFFYEKDAKVHQLTISKK